MKQEQLQLTGGLDNAIEQYTSERCQPLVDALEKIISAREDANQTGSLFPALQEIQKAKSALNNHKQQQ